MPIVTPTLLSDGKEIDTKGQELSIDIRREVNRIPHASVVLLDGDAALGAFPLSDAGFFEPGKEIEIKLRYESETEDVTVFKGPVVRHGVEATAMGSVLRVEMKDAAVKLTQARKSAVFVDQDDAGVIGKVIKAAGLQQGTIDGTTPVHEQMVQHNATDWDFILSRAEAQGMLTVVEDGRVSARRVDLSAKPTFTFEWGLDVIYDFEFEADAGAQYASVQSSAWDVAAQKSTAPVDGKDFTLAQGNLDGGKLAKAMRFEPQVLSYPVPLAPEELQAWADARLMRNRLSMIRGRLATDGLPEIKLFDVLEIKGVGDRFNGKTLVTGIRHRVGADGWSTDVQFGVSSRRFSLESDIEDAPAAGLLPGIAGLHVAVVDAFEDDPDKQFRVKVILPGVNGEARSVWARLAAPDAGNNRGWFFRPETGDEVVVGFFNEDPRQPVVLGGMYNPKNVPPAEFSEITEKNLTRVLVTKTGTVLGFTDDQKGSVFIETAAGARVLLDDSGKVVELLDQNGNELTMNEDGITLKSAKDLKLEASGNVEISGSQIDMN